MKVKVCMPDTVPLRHLGNTGASDLYKNQGQIIEVGDDGIDGRYYICQGFHFETEWFKVVEETPYQEWLKNFELPGPLPDPEEVFKAGRKSLKPFLRKTLEWINLNFDNCPSNPVGLREHIRKELER